MPTDKESELAAVGVGSGILLVQACAVIPGLLPCLLLLLPLVLPFVVLAAIGALLFAIPAGIRKVISS
jgi:hypothetical protein